MSGPARSPGVRGITLDAGGLALSALLGPAAGGAPRATVLALHGGGMSAAYFDGQAHPGQSLFDVGMRLGYQVLAVDRPGYGASAQHLPRGQTLAAQAATLRAALARFAAGHEVGAGVFVLAHSYGGKLALTCAAGAPLPAGLLGLDVSGCGHRFAVPADRLPSAAGPGHWRHNWGALRLYPPDTFRACADMVTTMPELERAEAARWPASFARLAARVRVPTRLTFAEHEAWWRHDEEALAELRERLASVEHLVVDRQPEAGHNISLGWSARTYHLRALAFFEECLARRAAAPARRQAAA
ncbi:alpha/beta hydrolase family protein [Streptomyces sp. NPDC058308]|uniref:alpha/beta hydrolase family protein n=1 Tax=Streptomyces sp. NPDC058308 TaxID=3346440 RepID=UPI0036E25B30